MGLTLEDLVTVIVQGFKSAFLPFREKRDLLVEVNRTIAETVSRFAAAAGAPGEEPARPSAPVRQAS
jgi:adenosine deaminase